MDATSSTHQMLNQIFGHQSTIDEPFGHFSSGNRNQYKEIERFDTDAELQRWIGAQGKQWGIVQKGRVTIEDIIDQYACVYRRRKGYACKVQMRVRHNRRNGHKVVEVLELDHDHTFYGCKAGSDFVDGAPLSYSDNDFLGQHRPSNLDSVTDDQEEANISESDLFGMIKQEQFDLSSLISGINNGNEDNQQQDERMTPLDTQPMELLLKNILQNAAQQQQQYNNINGEGQNPENGDGFEEEGGGDDQQAHEEGGYEGQFELMDGGAMQMMEQQQNEALAERVAEKMTNYLTSQLEPKFASILSMLNSLSKSVDELKRTVVVQQPNHHQQQQQRRPIQVYTTTTAPKSNSTSSAHKSTTPSSSSLQQQQHSSKTANTPKISFRPFPIPKLRGQTQQPQPSQFQLPQPPQLKMYPSMTNGHNGIEEDKKCVGQSSAPGNFGNPSSSSSSLQLPLLSPPKGATSSSTGDSKPFSSSSPGQITWASIKPSLNSLNFSKSATLVGAPAKLDSPRKPRKSVHAYRRRRKELSYRHMKEIGLTLIINGIPKSIFLCRVSDIHTAVQAKRRDLTNSGKKVMYRGTNVMDQLYRVDCSRVLVNGRRCGQMIADSLWSRGFFKQRMLMPILQGVNHRTKRRGDGTMRAAVSEDQFEVFKEALFLLGGFLMEETERSKWMETAREGVNQRGLDELANSKRAHFEFEGGPLFADEIVPDNDIGDEKDQQIPSATVFTSLLGELPSNLLEMENGQNSEEMMDEEEVDELEAEEPEAEERMDGQ